jgi:hypothetical protein
MNRFIVLIFAIGILFSTSGCSQFAYQLQTGSTTYAPTNPADIKIYAGDIDQPYVVIGSITADVVGDSGDLRKYLKKKAAKLGADAIIKVELTKMHSFTARGGISGVAVKFK